MKFTIKNVVSVLWFKFEGLSEGTVGGTNNKSGVNKVTGGGEGSLQELFTSGDEKYPDFPDEEYPGLPDEEYPGLPDEEYPDFPEEDRWETDTSGGPVCSSDEAEPEAEPEDESEEDGSYGSFEIDPDEEHEIYIPGTDEKIN